MTEEGGAGVAGVMEEARVRAAAATATAAAGTARLAAGTDLAAGAVADSRGSR